MTYHLSATLTVWKKRSTSRQQSSMILHASSVKEIVEKKSIKQKAKECGGHKGLVKSVKKLAVQTENNQNIDTENNICVVCFKTFEDSRPEEQWIKCNRCTCWVHDDCTPGFFVYVCHHCKND